MEEEESGSGAVGIEKLSIETARTEEEAADRLEEALGLEIEEDSEF